MTLLARAADRPQLVELGIDAVAHEAAVARERGRLVDERALDARRARPARSSSSATRLRTSGAWSSVEDQRARAGWRPATGCSADEIARAGRAERGAGDEPLEVLHGLQRLAELAALRAAERELLDRVEAIRIALERDERPEQPRPQQPAAHRA